MYSSTQKIHVFYILGVVYAFITLVYYVSSEPGKDTIKLKEAQPMILDNFPSCDADNLMAPSIQIPTIHIFTHNSSADDVFETTPAVVCLKPVLERFYATVKIRGHFSKTFDKKQLLFKTRNEFGKKIRTKLFNLEEHDTYVLAGPFIDTSFLRNALSFWMHNQMGGKSPSLQFVNVYFNMKDQGLFFLVPKPDMAFTGKENVDFWIKSDWCGEGQEAATDCLFTGNTHFSIQSHKQPNQDVAAKILQSLDDQTAQMRLMEQLETDKNLNPPPTDLASIMDLRSFARYYIIEEISKNVDAYAWSNMMYIKDGMLKHGSVWDYHMGYAFCCNDLFFENFFGQVNVGPQGWNADIKRDKMFFANKGDMHPMINYRMMWTNLFHTPEFYTIFQEEWKTHRRGALSTENILSFIDEQSSLFIWSAYRDQALWSGSFRCSVYDCCSPRGAFDVLTAIDHLKGWIILRTEWIDENIDLISSRLEPL